jgi:beta-carotene 15,15'-dioxygenase
MMTTPLNATGLSSFVQSGRLPSGADALTRWPVRPIIFCLTILIAGSAFGLALDGAAATQICCTALLIIGLPHGSFDFQVLRDSAEKSFVRLAFAVSAYLGLAAATYAFWTFSGIAALAGFLAISILHFEEDWRGAGSSDQRFLTLAIPISLISLPALSHPDALRHIFAGLAGQPGAATIVDILMMICPVATGVAAIAVTSDWVSGDRPRASATMLSLLAMIILPPIAGFAIFFCVVHSPRHFHLGLKSLEAAGIRDWRTLVVPLTLCSGVIFAVIFVAQNRITVSDTITAATFMTLSILTVPHMVAPYFIRLVQRV